MKKICYITTVALSIRSFFIPQLKHLAENGYDVTVICSPDEALQDDLGEGIKFIPVSIARGVSPMTLGKSIIDLVKVFKREKFDIVQYSTPNAGFCGSIAAKLAGVKVRNYHLMGLRYLGMGGIVRKLFKAFEKMSCSLSTHVECITPSNLELCIKEKLFKADKGTMIWNGSTGGVDIKRFDASNREAWRNEIRSEVGIKDDEFVFGFVGRLTRDKGVNEILEAYRNLKDRARLLIIGVREGTDTLDTEHWEFAEESDRVTILDFKKDIERYYSAMDVLLLPSYREGFGMVIAEAAAVGTPAIVSNIPGPVDVIDNEKTALTVEVKNAQDLRDKMSYMLDNPDMVKGMSANCSDFIKEKFDSRVLNKKILERKDKLLGEL